MIRKHDPSQADVPDKSPAPPLTAQEEWRELFKTVGIALFFALLVRTFFYEPFNIPSGSMKPTLEIGDYLFVSKTAYGYSRHSFPFGFAPIEGRIMTHLPRRGDVIVFKLPTNPRIDFIKRLVGLPGDRIQVSGGRLYINGQRVPREPVKLRRIEEGSTTSTVMEYIETLPGGARHRIYEESDDHPLDNTPEFVVPEGHYFLMGDNRDNSQDSRVQHYVGFVPFENFVGRSDFLFFSIDSKASLSKFWEWPWHVRYSRIFQGLHPERDDPPPTLASSSSPSTASP